MTDNPDRLMRRVFSEVRTIACVGASPNPSRPSHYVSRFLIDRGYRVIPVNPGQAGKQVFGQVAVARLDEISESVEMIDIFRRSDRLLGVVEEALAALPALRFVWMQEGLRDAEAAALARARGVAVIEDRCPLREYPRLFGDLRRSDIPPGGA